jgi:small-conductance mechanosensitive channel
VLAVVVVAVTWYGSKLVVRLLSRRVARWFRRPSVVQTVLGSVPIPIALLATFVAAGVAGLLRIGDIVLSATVLTGATVLVLTPIIGSVVNGLLILADQPYEIGDMIEFVDSTDRAQGGQRGFVEDINLRYTKIFTIDTTFIVVPNGTMRDRAVINYSAQDPRTRLSLDVLVTYEGDLEEARDLIERAAREAEVVVSGGPPIRIGAARYPAAPTCYINEFGDHGVLLTLRYWACEPYELFTVRSAVQENVWSVLDDADVEMAYRIRISSSTRPAALFRCRSTATIGASTTERVGRTANAGPETRAGRRTLSEHAVGGRTDVRRPRAGTARSGRRSTAVGSQSACHSIGYRSRAPTPSKAS